MEVYNACTIKHSSAMSNASQNITYLQYKNYMHMIQPKKTLHNAAKQSAA